MLFPLKRQLKKKTSQTEFVGFLKGAGVQGEGVTGESDGFLGKIEEPWSRFLLLFQGVGNHPHLFHCFDGWESQMFQKHLLLTTQHTYTEWPMVES